MKNKEDKLKKDELEQRHFNAYIPVQDDSGIGGCRRVMELKAGMLIILQESFPECV